MKPRNKILLAMILSMAVGYMPWYNFSAVVKYLSEEFHLTSTNVSFFTPFRPVMTGNGCTVKVNMDGSVKFGAKCLIPLFTISGCAAAPN